MADASRRFCPTALLAFARRPKLDRAQSVAPSAISARRSASIASRRPSRLDFARGFVSVLVAVRWATAGAVAVGAGLPWGGLVAVLALPHQATVWRELRWHRALTLPPPTE